MTSPKYDFWINDLGWNFFITKENPLERATAQFRKDQFDAASAVGDQSLTGWWTRGQFSFHKGAGVKYYETLDGETVLNRYRDGLAVDPFSEAGEVSLAPGFAGIYSAAAVDSVVEAPAWDAGGVLARTTTGDLKLIPASGAAPTTITGSGDFLATDGTYFYVASGADIYSQGNNPRVVANNYVTNAGPAGSPPTDWSLGFFGAGAGTLDSGSFRQGVPSGRAGNVTFSTDPDDTWQVATTVSGLTVGHDYEFSIWLWTEVQAGPLCQVAPFVGTDLGAGITLGYEPQRVTMTFRATATFVDVGFFGPAGALNGYAVAYKWSSAMVTEAPTLVYYGDENTPGWSMPVGHPVRTAGSSSDLVALWTNELDSYWAGIFWAKGRMFAVDENGRWFAMAPSGQIAKDDDTFWRSALPASTDTPWALTDSPGSVFIARGRNIWSLSVEDNGLLPALAVPTLAAQLPATETVYCIQHYLGQLIIATSAGIRIAAIDGTDVAYGPLVVEGSSLARRIAARGNSAYLPVLIDGNSSLVELSFLDEVSSLVRPYTRTYELAGDGTLPCGVLVADDNTLRVFDEIGVKKESGLATLGTLTAGYVRMGTLDLKSFRSVRVKTAGTVGVVNVLIFKPDDPAEYTVANVPAGETQDIELTKGNGIADPLEYLGVKFELVGDGSDGPTLLGYQLRAVPAPKRQRLMRVPLMLFDHETNRTGQRSGTSGSAWTRLAALEALEESNAVITFEDKETGESGDGYIESIEVRRTAPGSRTKQEGFGGLVYVTIRKL